MTQEVFNEKIKEYYCGRLQEFVEFKYSEADNKYKAVRAEFPRVENRNNIIVYKEFPLTVTDEEILEFFYHYLDKVKYEETLSFNITLKKDE